MTTLAIRKKLVAYVQNADDKKVKAMYAILETDLKDTETITLHQYSNELELADKEIENGKFVTHTEVLKSRSLHKITK
jgi:hypothetical protein